MLHHQIVLFGSRTFQPRKNMLCFRFFIKINSEDLRLKRSKKLKMSGQGNLVGPLEFGKRASGVTYIEATGGQRVDIGRVHGRGLIYKEAEDPNGHLHHLVWILNTSEYVAYPVHNAAHIAQLKFEGGTPDSIKPERIFYQGTDDFFVFLGHADPPCFVREKDLKDRTARLPNRFLIGGVPYQSSCDEPEASRNLTRVHSIKNRH